MNIRELKEDASVKYDIEVKKEQYALHLKGMFSYLDKKNKESIFLGYKEGSNQVEKIKVILVKTDKDAIKQSREVVYMNINRLEPTRIKKEVSTYMRNASKVMRKSIEMRKQKELYEQKERETRNKFYEEFGETQKIMEKNIKPDIIKLNNKEILKELSSKLRNSYFNGASIIYELDSKRRYDIDIPGVILERNYEGYMELDYYNTTEEKVSKNISEILKKRNLDEPHLIEAYNILAKYAKSKNMSLSFMYDVYASAKNDGTINFQLRSSINMPEKSNKLLAVKEIENLIKELNNSY